MRAEMRHYRAHCIAARDASSLAALRLECASLLADALRSTSRAPTSCRRSRIPYRFWHTTMPGRRSIGWPRRASSSRSSRTGTSRSRDVLARLGLAEPFEVIVTAAAIGAAKPDARPFQAALERLGSDAARTVHVGDDPVTDIAGARAAGLSAVLLDRSGRAPGLDREPRRARCPPGARRVTPPRRERPAPPGARDGHAGRRRRRARRDRVRRSRAQHSRLRRRRFHLLARRDGDHHLHVRRDGRSRRVGGAAHRRCAPRARPGRPALVAARRRPRARDRHPRARSSARRWSRSSMAPMRRASSRTTAVHPASGPWPACCWPTWRSPWPARSSRS